MKQTVELRHPFTRGRIRATLTDEHAASSYGLGVIVLPGGDILDGVRFAFMAATGWRLLAPDAGKACAALGVDRESELARAIVQVPARARA